MNVLRVFQTVGQDLYAGRLNNTHSGNLSVRIGARMLAITRSGALLHRLDYTDIVETTVADDDRSKDQGHDTGHSYGHSGNDSHSAHSHSHSHSGNDSHNAYSHGEHSRASRELPVHQAIYQGTAAQAIVHAHPPYLVALSMLTDVIRPSDAEGAYFFADGVPVVNVAQAIASHAVAAAVTPLLRTHNIVVVRGHGTFAVGNSLEDGLHWTSSLENSAQIILLQHCYRHLPNLT